MNKETTIDDWIKFVKKEVCDKCNYLNKSFGVCGGEILPIERAIMRNLEGRGNCKDIKEFAEQLKNEHERFAKEAYWSKYYKENGYELLNKEEVLFKAQHENKLKTILQKHNIDDDVINEIIKEYYSKNGGY